MQYSNFIEPAHTSHLRAGSLARTCVLVLGIISSVAHAGTAGTVKRVPIDARARFESLHERCQVVSCDLAV